MCGSKKKSHTSPAGGFLVWTLPPPWNFQLSFIFFLNINFGCSDPPSPRNFQWPSMVWVLIFSGTTQYLDWNRLLKITDWVIFFQTCTRHILLGISMSCGMKTPKFKNFMLYYENEGCYQAENLQKEMYLGCSITDKSWKPRGSEILHFTTSMRSRENKELFFSYFKV